MYERITSRHNPRVKDVRRLQEESRYRRKTRRFVVEGVRLAEEALRAGLTPEAVYLCPTILNPRGQALVAQWRAQGVPCFEITPEVLAAMSATETPQGILLVLPWPDLPWPEQGTMFLLLDGLQDPGNLGTILRTAWAAGVDGIWVLPGTVDVWSPKVVRAGMGAHMHLPIRPLTWDELPQAVAEFTLLAADAHAGSPYTQAPWEQPFVLAVGSEAHGLREPVRELADMFVHIPLASGVESLNAAVATGILLFEARRRRETMATHS